MTTTNTDGEWVVVRVLDEVNETLAGRPGVRYTSPPQSREDALTLVEMLLGRPPAGNVSKWRSAVAGGRRTVTLAGSDGDARP